MYANQKVHTLFQLPSLTSLQINNEYSIHGNNVTCIPRDRTRVVYAPSFAPPSGTLGEKQSEMSEEEERNVSPTDGSSEEEDEVSLDLVLSLPERFFDRFSAVEGYEELVSKIKDYVETKETELIDYQNTVREFEENLEERDNNISQFGYSNDCRLISSSFHNCRGYCR